ncbi:hypothetical protein IIC65_09375, partial [Candidatus Sumerlaeota bacterium]|nr:hypothetical protein [Candidatus Sumerlaeota bacterium]
MDEIGTAPGAGLHDPERPWQFWIDVGGTFTDCLARSPAGKMLICKVLSSGVVKGTAHGTPSAGRLADPQLRNFPPHFFVSYRLRVLGSRGEAVSEHLITAFDRDRGEITLADSTGAAAL